MATRKTVRELIEELSHLDQDKAIWQVYDPPYACWEARVDRIDGEFAEMFEDEGMQEGDYMFKCG